MPKYRDLLCVCGGHISQFHEDKSEVEYVTEWGEKR